MALDTAGEHPGDEIDFYTLIEPLGEGGFGRVWLAQQTEPVRRQVALKILKPGMDTDEVVSRFREEWKSLALMEHPGIARVFDAGVTPSGRPYFTMELVDGQPITSYCDDKALNVEERLRLFIKVCHAVQHAHQRGLIHRDLKPSNILVCGVDGSHAPRVIDFGTARALDQAVGDRSFVTRLHQIIGTPGYMSPEQVERDDVNDIDTRADIYSLGAVLYEMLTGTLPHGGEGFEQAALEAVLRQVREVIPPQPSRRITTLGLEEIITVARQRGLLPERLRDALRGDLDWITLKCLEKDRQRRYESVGALAQDIRLHLENRPVAARPPDRAYLMGRAIRRNRLAFTLGSVALVALIAAASISSLFFLRERKSRLQAESLRRESEASRQAANHARSSAEDLIDWALGDLRNKLGPLGRLDLLDNIGSATDAYYSNLPPGEGRSASGIRRARVHLLQGDIFYERNELPEAIGHYQEGISLIEPCLIEDITLEAKQWYAVLLFRNADALHTHGKFDQAVAMRKRHAEVARELVELQPGETRATDVLCTSLRKLAESLDRAQQPDAARETLDEAITLSRQHHPGHLRMLLQVRGSWEMRANNYPEAVAAFGEAVAEYDKVAQSTPDLFKELRYGIQSRGNLAYCLMQLDKDEEARQELRLAAESCDHFERIEPGNRDVLRERGSLRMVSGSLHFKTGNETAAIEDYHESLGIFTRLSGTEPSQVFWHDRFSRLIGHTKPLVSRPDSSVAATLLVAEIHLSHAGLLEAGGKKEGALAGLKASDSLLGKLSQAEPADPRVQALETRAEALRLKLPQ